jgi:Fe-S oxidoreductase
LTPTRQEFLYFSLPEKILFYLLIYASIAYMVWQFLVPYRLWMKGRPLPANLTSAEQAKKWLANIAVYVLAQKKVRSSRKTGGAPMHLAIFYGFMTLLLATTLLGINTYSPIKFHYGTYFLIYEQVTDWMGLVFLIGVAWAAVRRVQLHYRAKPAQPSAPSDYWTLALLATLGFTGFWVEAARISVEPRPWDWTDPVGRILAHVQGDWSALPQKALLYQGIWWLHALLVCGFFCVLPRMRIRHILLAVASVAGRSEEPMGKLRLVTMEEVEKTEQVGAKLATDYSRWHLLSLDACMECGRCTEVCPAWAVGKVLNPRQIVQDVRAGLRSGGELAPLISEEALWACTTCNACVEACPVLIRHVDLIVDVRRNLVSEGALSGSGAVMLRQTASTDNAWGASSSSREDWMQGLDIPLCREKPQFEWLFWVGCAGATDPGAIKTTKAVAQLLKKAGIDFACLGREEACTGDPARRVGEEFLFQEEAGKNVAAFAKYGIKKIVTACPHCFNSFKNEYGDVGVDVEVVHHTQLLGQLIRKGSLVAANPSRGSVTLHDPCYLTRINGDSDSPRELLSESVAEPEHRREKTLCCGAGGGRMWMEEEPSRRPGNRRALELVATGAEKVAVACPFCRIMLGDSLKQVDGGSNINLVDLAELMMDANQTRETSGQGTSGA